MHVRNRHSLLAATAVLLLAPVLGYLLGCRVDSHKQGSGEDVKIATPFGGLSVKTDEGTVQSATGLPAYPGAQLVKKNSDDGKEGKDSGAADIDMSFGSFRLRVKALSYRTTDPPAKVLAFYQQGMAQFGPVIRCSDHQPVGTPTHTPEGLDCSEDEHTHTKLNVNTNFSDKIELKAGSKLHQHIVAIDPEGTGTKFGLIALDLPGHISLGDDDKKSSGDGQEQ